MANICIYIAEIILLIVNDPIIGKPDESVLVSTKAMWNIPLYILSAVILGHIKWYFVYSAKFNYKNMLQLGFLSKIN